jgi:hypothetical protein
MDEPKTINLEDIEDWLSVFRNMIISPCVPKKPITIEQIKKAIEDVQKTYKPKNEITVFQGCLDRGTIQRTSSNLNLCNNPNCENCRNLEEALEKEIKS